jgi:hypothetical protein
MTIANRFASKTSNDAFPNMVVDCGGGPTDFIVDIFGYYETAQKNAIGVRPRSPVQRVYFVSPSARSVPTASAA